MLTLSSAWWKSHCVITRLIFAYALLSILLSISQSLKQLEEFLLCRHCGHEIVDAHHLVTVPGALAIWQRNETIHGIKAVLIQRFKNPQGQYFEVITASQADVTNAGDAYVEHSWFPGYMWTVVVCPRCGFHLGWSFSIIDNSITAARKSFIGLILDNLLHQTIAESLLMTPKSMYS